MGRAVMILGVIILLLGLFYAGVSHDVHTSTGLAFGWDHTMHQILGIALVIVGLVAIVKGRK